ncbi:MAG: O-antigen ligase family protein [Candidatus Omnitrophica bacterium]|nr:O-antigen ligase family protein [Candidatus Omnitrophota bacterium]
MKPIAKLETAFGSSMWIFAVVLLALICFLPQEIYEMHSGVLFSPPLLWIACLGARQRSLKFLWEGTHRGLWLALGALGLSCTAALDRNTAWTAYVSVALPFAGYYFLGYFLWKEGFDRARIFIGIWVAFAALIALIGVVEWLVGSNLIYERWVGSSYYERYVSLATFPRPLSTQSHPPILASFLLGCLPFALWFYETVKKPCRPLALLAISLMVTGILLAGSRGGFLSACVAVLVYLWHRNRRAFWITLGVVLLMPFVLYTEGPPVGFYRFGTRHLIHGGYDSVVSPYRMLRLILVGRVLLFSPVLGLGLTHLRLRFFEFFPSSMPVTHEFMIADNMYLTVLAETGLVGFIFFYGFVFRLVWRAYRRIRSKEPLEDRGLGLAAWAALLGLLVNMGGYDLLYWHNPWMLLAILCGMLRAFVPARVSIDATH